MIWSGWTKEPRFPPRLVILFLKTKIRTLPNLVQILVILFIKHFRPQFSTSSYANFVGIHTSAIQIRWCSANCSHMDNGFLVWQRIYCIIIPLCEIYICLFFSLLFVEMGSWADIIVYINFHVIFIAWNRHYRIPAVAILEWLNVYICCSI